MGNTVLFRDFEDRDIDFIYKCKNDEKLNSKIVGSFHHFTYEEAVQWVHGCMGEHETYRFWAVCTNDDEKRIVGWVSLSQIDRKNHSACFHGIVIADEGYRDGVAWIESYLFIYEQAFEVMGINRLYGTCRVDNKLSMQMSPVMFSQKEGILREAIYDNGQYVDLYAAALLAKDYFFHKQNGDYEIPKIMRRLVSAKKQSRKN